MKTMVSAAGPLGSVGTDRENDHIGRCKLNYNLTAREVKIQNWSISKKLLPFVLQYNLSKKVLQYSYQYYI